MIRATFRTAPSAATALLLLFTTLLPPGAAGQEAPETADLLLVGGTVWTGDEEAPRAEAVAISGERILQVGSEEEVHQHQGPDTRVLDVSGRFVMPGFIDNHTHFDSAGELLLGINLLDVASEERLVEEVRAARERLPEGAWIIGGDWGAYEQWERGSEGEEDGEEASEVFRPHRDMIEEEVPDTPVLFSKWDGSIYLANEEALTAAELSCDDEGVECDDDGRMTGRLEPEAARQVEAVIPEKSMEQRLTEARAALERLREHGVTTIHDITGPEQLRVFQQLKEEGELTTRVYARPTLDKWEALAEVGIEHGFGDDWLRIGGLKGFVDGIMGNSSARFYEPYRTTGERGQWREMMRPPGNMQRLLIGADSAGHWPQVHAIGDEAIDSLLTMFENTYEANGERERRFRVIHAQVLRGPEVAERMARLDVIAEMQPYHAIDDMRWMEERIGERARWAYAFNTIDEAGVRLSFGSDWPGTNAAWYTSNPLMGVYAAVTRQTPEGRPEGGWYPEERIDVEMALRAYTVNNAFAEGQEDRKGRLEPGFLADLVVLSEDPTEIEPSHLPEVEVLYTMVGGEVVYQHERSE